MHAIPFDDTSAPCIDRAHEADGPQTLAPHANDQSLLSTDGWPASNTKAESHATHDPDLQPLIATDSMHLTTHDSSSALHNTLNYDLLLAAVLLVIDSLVLESSHPIEHLRSV